MPILRYGLTVALLTVTPVVALRAGEVDWNARLRSAEEMLNAAKTESDRFEALGLAAMYARHAGDLPKAVAYGTELLRLAEAHKNSWDYGNAIHQGHLLLGEVAFSQGNADLASKELLLAGKTPGSPQLSSFGPSMPLAKKLLEADKKDAVLQYLQECRTFWKMDNGLIDSWMLEIKKGNVPDFKSNVAY